VFASLTRALDVQLNALKSVESRELGDFNAALRRKGVAEVTPKTPELQQPGGRRRGGGEEGGD
jgi:hypothetical protein